MKTLQDLIFSKQFRQGISEGIKEAVASSEAAGLPKSYINDYSELPSKRTEHKSEDQPRTKKIAHG